MTPIDTRLDFFNALKEFTDNLTEDDSVLVLTHNRKDGDCFTALCGDWSILSALLSTPGYIVYQDGDQERTENIKKCIVNIAYNIINKDERLKEIIKNKLFLHT